DEMHVAAAGIGLPYLDQSVRHRALVLIKHLAVHDDALAERLAGTLLGKVVVALLHRVVAVDRTGQFRQRMRDDDQRLRRRALDRALVAGRQMLGEVLQALGWIDKRHKVPSGHRSCSFTRARWRATRP